jgi:hypothetical protein
MPQNPQTTLPELPPPPDQSHQVLESTTPNEFIVHVEKTLLKFLSFILHFHGAVSIYNELVEIFYVFPYLPEVFRAFNYSESVFQALIRRSILVVSTAVLETIYALVLIHKHSQLAHRVHLISGTGLLAASLLVTNLAGPINIGAVEFIPQPPTLGNLLRQDNFEAALQLFSRRNNL